VTAATGDEIVVVFAIDVDEDLETVLCFSTMATASTWAANDKRAHVFSTRVLDAPEHHEQRSQ